VTPLRFAVLYAALQQLLRALQQQYLDLMIANHTVRGIAFMCLAVTLFPFLNATVKVLGADYAIQQVIWVRYLGHFGLMLLIFLPFHGLGLFRTKNLSAQVVRSLLLLGSTTCYFLALSYLPLTTAAAISFTSPFIVTALSVPFLGEKVGPRRWSAIAVGFIGALIIIRPGGAHLSRRRIAGGL
jgi:drug/metabolite transporter (DMT)-like permease